MLLDRAWIERHIPHQGRMCLLDEVIDWDLEHIRCRGRTHGEADHPLRAHDRLGIAGGVEYAAQAMAVHGALLAGALAGGHAKPPAAGLLAGVRGVRFSVLRLDDVRGDLICSAVRVAGNGGSALYEFELRSESLCLLSGRATVLFDLQVTALP